MRLRRLICLLSMILIGVTLTGCKKSESLLTEDVSQHIENRDYGAEFRKEAVALKNYKATTKGFSIAGNVKDTEMADYLVERMTEIGLDNVRKVSVPMDGWNITDMSFKFECNCEDDLGYQNFHNIGVYPSNFEFNEDTFELVNVGKLADFSESVENKGVLLSSAENLKEEVEIAVSKGASFVAYNDKEQFNVLACKVDVTLGISNEIPVFALPTANYDILAKEIEEGQSLEVTLTGSSYLSKNIESDFIIGELIGEKKNEYIYITANRDSIFEGFMSSEIGVGELLSFADTLKKEGYVPKYTIRFMITTGQEFGDIEGGLNIGIRNYIEGLSSKIKNGIKCCIVLDGSKPILGSTVSEYQTLNEKYKKGITSIGEKLKNENSGYATMVNDLLESDTTEASVWNEYGVPVILQAEPMSSNYIYVENTSKDDSSIGVESAYCNYLIKYLYDILTSVV